MRCSLRLTDEQKSQLQKWVKNPPRPYLRPRAWAILLVASGTPIYQVAGDHRVRAHRSTVGQWVQRFRAAGPAGLKIKPGRGRKPAYAPHTREEARAQVEEVLHRSPLDFGLPRTRWRLQDVQKVVAWLTGQSAVGVYKALKRLGFSRKQALRFIHSPDPDYQAKRQALRQAFQEACQHPKEVVILFLDGLTYYRQPSPAPALHPRGKRQPRALQSARANTQTRLVAALDGCTGQVLYLQQSKIGKAALIQFLGQLRAAYPHARQLYIVQDNWPVHKLPEVQAVYQAERLTPLFLPTYASWLNPIEKLWRWLKQEVLHLHRWAEALETLREKVRLFLDQFATGSSALLRYVGLLPE